MEDTDGVVVTQQRDVEHAANRTVLGTVLPKHLTVERRLGRILAVDDRFEVVVDDGPSLENCPALPGLTNERSARADPESTAALEGVRHPLGLVPDETVDLDVVHLAEAGGGVDDCLEDVCRLGRGGGDDPEYLAEGGLLLQRCRDPLVALLKILEQSGVGDGDGGLIRERLDQRDLARTVPLRNAPPDEQDADRLPIMNQGHADGRHRPPTRVSGKAARCADRTDPVRGWSVARGRRRPCLYAQSGAIAGQACWP